LGLLAETTLALQVAAHLQKQGLTVAWIDSDHAFDPLYAVKLGVEIERFAVVEPETAEEALEAARRLAISGAVDLLVVDFGRGAGPQPGTRNRDRSERPRPAQPRAGIGVAKTGDGRDQGGASVPVSQPDARPPRSHPEERRRPPRAALHSSSTPRCASRWARPASGGCGSGY